MSNPSSRKQQTSLSQSCCTLTSWKDELAQKMCVTLRSLQRVLTGLMILLKASLASIITMGLSSQHMKLEGLKLSFNCSLIKEEEEGEYYTSECKKAHCIFSLVTQSKEQGCCVFCGPLGQKPWKSLLYRNFALTDLLL